MIPLHEIGALQGGDTAETVWGKKTGREEILQTAIDLTTGDRFNAYGPPVENHQRIADLFQIITGKELEAHEVAMLLHCVKLSRIRQTPDHKDSYVDGAAYLGIAWECVSEGKE